MKTRHYISCFVIRRVGGRFEFLQLLRSQGRYLAGTWQLVNGRIEENETAWAAALREIFEETALRPTEFYQLDHVNTFYIAASDTLVHSPVFCAIVEADADVRLNGEHVDFRWVAVELLQSQLMWPGERAAAKELVESILDGGASKALMRIEISPTPPQS